MLRPVRIHQERLSVQVPGPGLHPLTAQVAAVVERAGLASGLCTVFVRHTSASLTIQENADPTVRADLQRFFCRLIPDGDQPGARYQHDAEGPDDMPAHIKSALTQTSLGIPLLDGALGLGTWQGIYLWEHRRGPHRRELIVQVLGQVHGEVLD
jgi:secondary thiamine-phosphate synthase enzyme